MQLLRSVKLEYHFECTVISFNLSITSIYTTTTTITTMTTKSYQNRKYFDNKMLKLSKSKQLQTVIFVLCCAFLLAQFKTVSALNCYTCSYLLDYSDRTCLENANLTRVTNCTKKYCTTIRQEAINNASKVISFLRDCQDKPLFLNGVQKDSTFRTYYRACQTDLCNDSNGKSAIIDVTLRPNATVANNQSTAPNGVIKGKNGSHGLHKLSSGFCMIVAFCLYLVFIP